MSLRPTLVLLFSVLLTACGGGDKQGPGAVDPCTDGLILCDGACVDTDTESDHCGACGNSCEEGWTCQSGACHAPCDEGSELCDGKCVRVAVDAAHCGSCGNACEEGEVCSDGSCMDACDEGLDACSGSCVDLQSDEEHCGACGVACGENSVCIAGSCECKPGLYRCGDLCVDTANDPQHCGTCFFDCTQQANVADATCGDGVCNFLCEEGAADCDELDTNGCETDLTSETNCGTCFNVCEGETTCNGESCVCAYPFEVCDGACVNTQGDDVRNCGACNRDCHAGGVSGICRSGSCLLFCPVGWGDCDDDPANGCEADFATDAQHCGTCGRSCAEGQVCVDGECERACDDGLRGCGEVCVDLANDPENCGSCGLSCEEQANVDSATCGGGSCNFVCSEEGGRWADCDGDSATGCEADLDTSVEHCGGCNQPCHGRCVDGECHLDLVISSHHRHTCALRPDGTVACWGWNSQGQLGDGTQTTPAQAVTVRRSDNTALMGVVELAAGGTTDAGNDVSFTCARTFEGRVYCWGDNSFGQLGTGGTSSSPYPELISGLTDVVQISAGSRHACAVLADGTARCWGNNQYGQIGNGQEGFDQWTPTAVRIDAVHYLEGVRQIEAGKDVTCAVLADETGTCWGANGNMQHGDGVGTGSRSFAGTRVVDGATMKPLQGITRIASGGARACALLKDGTARCWGYQSKSNGGLGDGVSFENTPYGVPVLESEGGPMVSDIAAIDVGESHVCLAFESGSAGCWGWNWKGRLGIDSDVALGRFHPVTLRDPDDPSQPIARKVVDIAAGFAHTCVVVEGGEAFCAGDNDAGQLGSGTHGGQENKLVPVVF